MPTFSYHGCDNDGAETSGTLEAQSEQVALETLQARGITAFSLNEGQKNLGPRDPWYRREITFGRKSLALSTQANSAELMATLFAAGLSSAEVMRISAMSTEDPTVRRQFNRTYQRLEDGELLSQAFKEENQNFSPIFLSLVTVGDKANAAAQQLEDLASYLRRQNTIRQRLSSALIYPTILIVAAFALLLVIVFYLAPTLEPLFRSAGKPLPGTLATLLAIKDLVVSRWQLLLLGSFCATMAAAFALQTRTGKELWASFLARLPVLGTVLACAELARLTQSTVLLLSSGFNIAEAMNTAARANTNKTPLSATFQDSAASIQAGGTASEMISRNAYIPNFYIELFQVGESANQLPSTLTTLARALNSRVETQTQRLLLLFTPFITLSLGTGVGLLVYSLMGAILEISDIAF